MWKGESYYFIHLHSGNAGPTILLSPDKLSTFYHNTKIWISNHYHQILNGSNFRFLVASTIRLIQECHSIGVWKKSVFVPNLISTSSGSLPKRLLHSVKLVVSLQETIVFWSWKVAPCRALFCGKGERRKDWKSLWISYVPNRIIQIT